MSRCCLPYIITPIASTLHLCTMLIHRYYTDTAQIHSFRHLPPLFAFSTRNKFQLACEQVTKADARPGLRA
jgi:hypothetical protein